MHCSLGNFYEKIFYPLRHFPFYLFQSITFWEQNNYTVISQLSALTGEIMDTAIQNTDHLLDASVSQVLVDSSDDEVINPQSGSQEFHPGILIHPFPKSFIATPSHSVLQTWTILYRTFSRTACIVSHFFFFPLTDTEY